MVRAKKIVLARSIQGEPRETDFQLVEEDLKPLQNKEILIEAEWLSVDPYMRLVVRNTQVGGTMFGSQVAKVIESKHPEYPVGSHLVGYFGWRTHTVLSPDEPLATPIKTLPTYKLPADMKLPRSLALGITGMPGITAYFGFLEICQPKAGEVVVVSTAAGAVGSVVGQIAKIKGCKVIGYTGSDEKVEWLKELGFDHAYNYKKVNLATSLKEAAPNGVDCYFDNVGGEISSAVLRNMNARGRVSVCGSISSYNSQSNAGMDPAIQELLVVRQIRREGFMVARWSDRLEEATSHLGQWIAEGKLKYKEKIYEGFPEMPKAFVSVFTGENAGKIVVKA